MVCRRHSDGRYPQRIERLADLALARLLSTQEVKRAADRKELLREFLLMSLGTLLVSVRVCLFKFPSHFSMGGVFGLTVLLGKLLPQPFPPAFNTIANVFFLVLGFVMFNRDFGARMVYCPILSTGLIQSFE